MYYSHLKRAEVATCEVVVRPSRRGKTRVFLSNPLDCHMDAIWKIQLAKIFRSNLRTKIPTTKKTQKHLLLLFELKEEEEPCASTNAAKSKWPYDHVTLTPPDTAPRTPKIIQCRVPRNARCARQSARRRRNAETPTRDVNIKKSKKIATHFYMRHFNATPTERTHARRIRSRDRQSAALIVLSQDRTGRFRSRLKITVFASPRNVHKYPRTRGGFSPRWGLTCSKRRI